MSKYTESTQIEQPAIALFEELEWRTYNAYDEALGEDSPLGRETSGQVVLEQILWDKLRELNEDIPEESLDEAIREITRDRSSLHPVRANQQVYQLIRDGIDVEYRDTNGELVQKTVRVIDWQEIENNDFLLVSQLWINGEMHRRRPDLIGFVNGLPLLLFELKKPTKRVYDAYHGNLDDYKDTIPQLFWYNQLIVLSNGTGTCIGTLSSPWEHFGEWKKISEEEEAGRVSLETAIRGIAQKERFMNLLEHFILFKDLKGNPKKFLAKNHQYLGVNNAIEAVRHIEENKGRLGVFWHTQGSGKSFSMIFFTRKIMRSMPGDWKFLIVTDRLHLDEQIYKNFASVGAVTEPEQTVRVNSKDDLLKVLRENHRYLFTTIHMFHTRDDKEFPVLTEDDDIIVITDEAHRTQYDKLAMNMRKALPNAAFIGFTGTPLIKGADEKTREVFGDYVSVYDFKQSIEDGATVPLYYENRIPELQLTNEHLNEELEELLDEAMLNEKQEEKLEREYRQEYHLLTRKDRLRAVADDIVDHFIRRGYLGKAMVISIDRFTAVRMYVLVDEYWQQKLEELKEEVKDASDSKKKQLEERIEFMEETDRAVVISQSQNEIRDFKQEGLDIRPHRKRIEKEPLDEYFKDEEHPLRMVFVCAMWITGFDVPSLSTLYLDKPMKNHTLMQTIARANRVFEEKNNGLIVAYTKVFSNLQKALAVYATGRDETEGGTMPVKNKEELVDELKQAIAKAKAFCDERGVDLDTIIEAEGFGPTQYQDEFAKAIVGYEELKDRVDDAVEVVLDQQKKKEFTAHANRVNRLYKAILPDPSAENFRPVRSALLAIRDRIKILGPQSTDDISEVREDINNKLDEAIGVEEDIGPYGNSDLIDLSDVDFEKLQERFAKKKHKRMALEQMKSSVAQKVQEMVEQNRTRMDFKERFEEMIEKYNNYSVNVEVQLEELFKLNKELDGEQKRHLQEELTEEQLVVLDIVEQHKKSELTESEREQIKDGITELLQKLKDELLVLDWKKHQQSMANVRVAIEEELDDILPDQYDRSRYKQTCNEVFDHVFQNYEDGEWKMAG